MSLGLTSNNCDLVSPFSDNASFPAANVSSTKVPTILCT